MQTQERKFFNKCRLLLEDACNTQEEYLNLLDAFQFINETPDDYGVVSLQEAMMSAETYHNIRKLILFPKETIVVDCGCGNALQQVFFNDCYKYIGIDSVDNFFSISENAILLKGTVEEILPKIDDEGKRLVGVSVLCGMCFENVKDAMFKKFTKVINI